MTALAALAALAAMAVLAAAGCGTDEGPVATPAPGGTTSGGDTAAEAAAEAAEAAADKVAPRWEEVIRFAGTGDRRTEGFDVAPAALQWRVTLSCTDGTVRVALDGDPSPLAEVSTCPGSTFGFSIRTGPAVLDVDATGAWAVVVDQQLDTPVAEPALAGMTDGNRQAAGEFYGIDQKGSGTASLYRLPLGGGALRFDPFVVTKNSDLFVWVSEADGLHSSADALHSPHVQVGRLTATAGAQNYLLPDTVDVDRVRSVVVWCEPVQTAYAAAALTVAA